MEFGWLHDVSQWIRYPVNVVATLAAAEAGRRLGGDASARSLKANEV